MGNFGHSLIFVMGFLLIGIHSENSYCGPPMSVCPADFMKDVRIMRTMMPEEDFLNNDCESVVQTLDCLVDYNKTCGSSRIRPKPMVQLKSIRQVVAGVCDKNSELGKGYRENIECVNSLKDEFLATFKRISDFMTSYMKFLKREKPGFKYETESSAVFCLGFSFLSADVARMAEANCGKEAMDTILLFSRDLMKGCPPKSEMAAYEQLYLRFISQPQT